MKILVVGGDCWNDSTNGNNVYSNWFDDFDAEFANIYIGQGTPENKVCSKYFQITDKMMLRSLYSDRAGVAFNTELCKVESESFDKDWSNKVKRNMGEGLRIAREVLWSVGRYNIVLFVPDSRRIFSRLYHKRTSYGTYLRICFLQE